MMSLVTNGCSCTEGYYLDNKTLAWPSVLGKMLNTNVCNLAMGAGSNDRIFRTSIQHLHLDQDIDFLVIGWTGIGRSEIPLHNGSYVKITPFGLSVEDGSLRSNPSLEYLKDFETKFYRWHYNKFVWTKNLLSNIITLQTLCEKKKIKLKQFFAIEPLIIDPISLVELCDDSYEFFKLEHLPFTRESDFRVKVKARDRNVELIQNLIEQIDTANWIGWPTTTMLDSCKNFKFDWTGHPMEDGHQHWAQVVYDSLR
jgi:hypothetical protein